MPTEIEKNIDSSLRSLQKKGRQYYAPLLRKVTIKSYDIWEGKISVKLMYGYGLNEEIYECKFLIDTELNDFFEWTKNFYQVAPPTKTPPVMNNNEKEIKPNPEAVNASDELGNTFQKMRLKLYDAIDKISSGQMSAEQGKAIANVSQSIINSVKLEFEVAKALGKEKEMKLLE